MTPEDGVVTVTFTATADAEVIKANPTEEND